MKAAGDQGLTDGADEFLGQVEPREAKQQCWFTSEPEPESELTGANTSLPDNWLVSVASKTVCILSGNETPILFWISCVIKHYGVYTPGQPVTIIMQQVSGSEQ